MSRSNLEKILCVDDDLEQLELLKYFLEESGFSVLTATDGYKALDLLGDHNVIAVISDWNMPNMRGDEFYEKAQKIRLGQIFIFLSGHLHVGNARPQGTFTVLYKPCSPQEILKVIRVLKD